MSKTRMRFVGLLGFLLFSAGVWGQSTDDSRFLQPTASVSGSTGLWKVHGADILPPGQASFSFWYDRLNRNPGFLTVSTIGFGGSVGINSWLEFGANLEANRRVLVRRADQLSFGQQTLGLFGNQTPGAAPFPNEVVVGSRIMPQLRLPPFAVAPLGGAAGYNNLFPFASQIQGNGIGAASLGFKINIFSERLGYPMGLGVRTYASIPTRRSVSSLLVKPTQTGDWQYGTDVLLSKNLGELAELHGNFGFRRIQSPGNGRDQVLLADDVPLGFGFVLPRTARLQLVGEATADLFVGSHTRNTSFDAPNPIDFTLGFRAFLSPHIGFSAGYRRPLNQFGGDKSGFIFQLTYNYGPSPERIETALFPPGLSCSADPSEVLAGEPVRLTAQGVSSAGLPLTYDWNTASGTIEGSGPVVQLRTDNLAPGRYTALVRASDGPGSFADCTTGFTVKAPLSPAAPPASAASQPPTVSCSASRTSVRVGEVVSLTAQARSPENRPLTYAWSSTGGRVEGTGASVRFDTTNLPGGRYTLRVRVTDDAGQSAECSLEIVVEEPPSSAAPQTALLNQCRFAAGSARVDNVCKAILDEAALRLQNERDATLTIVGFAASGEQNPQQLAATRAANTKAYLEIDKGIAENRLAVRTGASGSGAAMRKVEIHLVPRGATFTAAGIHRPSPAELIREAIPLPLPGSAAQAHASFRRDADSTDASRRVIATTSGASRKPPAEKPQPKRVVIATAR